MFDDIVVIVDGSETSDYAVGAGITVALEGRGVPTFCVAVDPAIEQPGAGGEGFADLARMMCRPLLDNALAEAKRRGIPNASGKVFSDRAARGVIAIAHDLDAGLIVLGAKPRVGLLRPFIRDLAEQILNETMIPLCIVRRPTRGKLSHRILVPIVDEPLSLAAVQYAIRVAIALKSTLVFCTVEDHDDVPAADRVLTKARARADAASVPNEELKIPLHDGIPDAIARAVDLRECDSIVMASHVRQGLPRLIEGSVSEAVIYACDVPVVIVRLPRGEEKAAT